MHDAGAARPSTAGLSAAAWERPGGTRQAKARTSARSSIDAAIANRSASGDRATTPA
jgi:hypothetical protein